MNRSITSICNAALDLVPAQTIMVATEISVSANVCKRHYAEAVAFVLSKHDWNFARRRVLLQPVENDRADYWGYAYAFPSGVALPIAVYPVCAGTIAPHPSITYVPVEDPLPMMCPPEGGPMIPCPPGEGGPVVVPPPVVVPKPAVSSVARWYVSEGSSQLVYDLAGWVIYTSSAAAALEYVDADVDTGGFTAGFYKALEYELASRICLPLRKDRGEQQALQQQAVYWLNQARADDANSRPRRYGDDYVSDSLLARIGALPDWGSGFGGVRGGW